MRRPQSPCKDCTDRSVNCHAECEVYNWFQKELQDYKSLEYENRDKAKKLKISYNKRRQERVNGIKS